MIVREQFKIIFANGESANDIMGDDIEDLIKENKNDRITIVTPSENQNFTEKDARSVKKPKPTFFGQSQTLKQFSQNAINENLSLPSVHFLRPNNIQGNQHFPSPDAERLVQIKPITDTYLAPPEDERSNEEYVNALPYTLNDDYYNTKEYSYYDNLPEYGDLDDDTFIEPKPEKTLGNHIPLSKLKLDPQTQIIEDYDEKVSKAIFIRENVYKG